MDPLPSDPPPGVLPLRKNGSPALPDSLADTGQGQRDSVAEAAPELPFAGAWCTLLRQRTPSSGKMEELNPLRALMREQLTDDRALFEVSPQACILTDGQGVIQKTNELVAGLFGHPGDFLVGLPLPLLIAAEDRPAFYGRLAQINQSGETTESQWEVRIQPRQGPLRDVAVSVTAVREEEGQPAQLRWLLRNITECKRAEGYLQYEKEFSESLLELAEVFVLVVDRSGIIQRFNTRVQSLSGRPQEELLRCPWWEVVAGAADQPRARTEFQRACVGEGRWQAVFSLCGPGGAPVAIQWSGRPLGGVGAAAPTFLLVGHDITQLQQAQEHALRAERLASIGQVAAGLAHESRNALQRAQACLSLLRWKCQGLPDAIDLIDRLSKAQADLHHLYEDIREYAAPIRLERQPCDLPEVWREVWRDIASAHADRTLQLEEHVEGADLHLVADSFRLGQVFRNIVENAVQAGATLVQIRCRDGTFNGQPALCVSVRDDGPGLTPEQRQHLFEPLYTTKTRGSGLGMAIVKRLIEAHGGEVGLGAGPGAEILFTLPRRSS